MFHEENLLKNKYSTSRCEKRPQKMELIFSKCFSWKCICQFFQCVWISMCELRWISPSAFAWSIETHARNYERNAKKKRSSRKVRDKIEQSDRRVPKSSSLLLRARSGEPNYTTNLMNEWASKYSGSYMAHINHGQCRVAAFVRDQREHLTRTLQDQLCCRRKQVNGSAWPSSRSSFMD